MPKIERGRTEILTVSIPKSLKQHLKKFASEEDLPVSKVTKDALRYYIWRKEWKKAQEAFAPAFEKLGIKTDDDIEKYFG